MLNEIIKIIYPDQCEVIEVEPHLQYVYPIFKCGRSSVVETAEEQGWRTVSNHDIANITVPITVFVRPPKERFRSGVNTYLQHVMDANPLLDASTVLYFVKQYPFLNRHYAPQFAWLLNLARFGGINQPLEIKSMSDIGKLTVRNSDAGVAPAEPWVQQCIDQFDWHALELYMFLDQIIVDRVGQIVTLSELIGYLRDQHCDLYNSLFGCSKQLADIVHAVS